MLLTYTEENYLKTLLKLTLESKRAEAGTNELATHLMVKPATVSDMLKKLKEKQLVDYEKYGKITLTDEGKKIGIEIIDYGRHSSTKNSNLPGMKYMKLPNNWSTYILLN